MDPGYPGFNFWASGAYPMGPRAEFLPGVHPMGPRGGFLEFVGRTKLICGPSPGTNELPIRPNNLRIRPWKYFFMPRSILMLPGLKILTKVKK